MKAIAGRVLASRFYHRPVFLVGAGRSGTIVLFRALGEHPEIFSMPSENPLLTSIAAMVQLFESGPEKDYFLESVKISKDYLYRHLRQLSFESSAGSHNGLKVQVKYLWKNKRKIGGARYWCVKCFPIEDHAAALLRLYPMAKFVYIVRNGVDVVQSRTKFPAFRNAKFSEHCRVWAGSVQKFDYLRRLDAGIMVKQEDLVSNPDVLFGDICRHLGIESSSIPVEFAKTTLVHSLGDKDTHRNVKVRESLQSRAAAYEGWSDSQRRTFMKICESAMRELEYDLPF